MTIFIFFNIVKKNGTAMKESKQEELKATIKPEQQSKMYVKSHGITYEWKNILLSSSTVCVYVWW